VSLSGSTRQWSEFSQFYTFLASPSILWRVLYAQNNSPSKTLVYACVLS
jgi:hypothetical protein